MPIGMRKYLKEAFVARTTTSYNIRSSRNTVIQIIGAVCVVLSDKEGCSKEEADDLPESYDQQPGIYSRIDINKKDAMTRFIDTS